MMIAPGLQRTEIQNKERILEIFCKWVPRTFLSPELTAMRLLTAQCRERGEERDIPLHTQKQKRMGCGVWAIMNGCET
jgi:hypothetical protein